MFAGSNFNMALTKGQSDRTAVPPWDTFVNQHIGKQNRKSPPLMDPLTQPM